MTDPRVEKLAKVITEYSVGIKPGDRVYITASPVAQPLTLAIIEQVIKRGGHPHITAGSGYNHLDLVPGATELMLKYGSAEQLQYVNPFELMAVRDFDVRIAIKADTNTKSLSNVEPKKIAMADGRTARAERDDDAAQRRRRSALVCDLVPHGSQRARRRYELA